MSSIFTAEASLTYQVATRHPQSKEWEIWCKRYQGKGREIKGPLSPVRIPMPLTPTHSKKFTFTV
jgi:hypothetical protein